jgi:hypothetical protein
MLKHIVMWKLKEHAEGADRATNAAKMKPCWTAAPSWCPAS